VLSAFVVINIALWRYVLFRVKPIIHESRKLCKEGDRYFEVERLEVTEEYISGKWQRNRFIVMLIIVVLADLVCFAIPVREMLSSGAEFIFPSLSASSLAPILPDLSILLYVVVAEGWIWVKRLVTRTSLHVIEALNDKYVLEERPADH
jgi:hypothetical protein